MRPFKIVALVLVGTAFVAFAEPEAETTHTQDLLDQVQDSFRNVADELFSSLVFIETVSDGGASIGAGSGFIVDHDTENNTFYVATNDHVAGGSYEYMRVTSRDGRPFEAVLVGSDPRYDVALVSFQYSTDDVFDWSPTVVSIGDSDAVQAGDLVYALGGPRFLPETLTLGIVSNPSRDSTMLSSVREYIQTDTSINPGNSGGPLVTLRDGKVIGINTIIFGAQIQGGSGGFAVGSVGLGFAVPINVAMQIIGNLREYGTPRHGYIGVDFAPRGAIDVWGDDVWGEECDSPDDVDWELDDQTVAMIMRSLTTIMNVTPLAPADRHGLKPGDVIVAVDGEFASVVADTDRTLIGSPANYSKLVRMIDALEPGTDSTFEVIRGCDDVEITLQAGIREEEDAGDRALASWPGMLLDADLSVLLVAESGVAAGLGIAAGDVITHVNSEQIDNRRHFYRSIDACRTDRCSLGVYRNGVLSWSPDFTVPRH